MSMFDDGLVAEFVMESREHLNSIEPDLLSMEEGGATVSQELINRVFRAIHSVKGGAGFLAFNSLKNLSHIMESVLMLVRDGKLTLTPEIVDVLLRGVDKLRTMLDDIANSEGVPCAEEIEMLQKILEAAGAAPVKFAGSKEPKKDQPPKETAQGFDISDETVARLKKQGMNVYRVVAYAHKDIKDRGKTPLDFLNNLELLGEYLDSSIEPDECPTLANFLEKDLAVTFIFASVLEADLVSSALEVAEAQVTPLAHDDLISPATSATTVATAPKVATPAPATIESQSSASTSSTEAPETKQAKTQSDVADTLRVRVDLLTRLMNLAGELVLARNQLMSSMAGVHSDAILLGPILQNVDRVTAELQEGIMQTRMQPIGTVFNRFTRVVRDISRQLGKEIELTIKGGEVELDKSILELLSDPLTHIIRNSADHAIEPPEVREKAGKTRSGTIAISAYHEGGQVHVRVSDDGAGIDPNRVKRKAIERGLIRAEEGERMSQRELVNLVFAPGFSTAEKVSDVSGRGVGMDVVRTNIEKLNGSVRVDSTVGQGTTVLIQLPLTLAIISSLVVGAGGNKFAVPQISIQELVWVRASEVASRIVRLRDADVLHLRGMLLPLVRLADVLGIQRAYRDEDPSHQKEDRRNRVADRRSRTIEVDAADSANVETGSLPERVGDRRTNWRGDFNIVVVKAGANNFGLVVEELFDTEEIVVKPLSSYLRDTRCFSGATILGNGSVITILDTLGVSSVAKLKFSEVESEQARTMREEEERRSRAESREAIILFENAPSERFAVMQDSLLRLERINLSTVQRAGGREFITYGDRTLPLLRIDEFIPVTPIPDFIEEAFLLLPKPPKQGSGIAGIQAGILVSRIIDAIEAEVKMTDTSIKGTGMLGAAVVNNHTTLFLDIQELARAASA
jgi:two-component system chemotaxis sensor kinase CheA